MFLLTNKVFHAVSTFNMGIFRCGAQGDAGVELRGAAPNVEGPKKLQPRTRTAPKILFRIEHEETHSSSDPKHL